MENVAIALIDGCVLNAIYDRGPSDTYVEENGIGAFYNSSSSTWNIVHTPNTSYVIPETISGKTINGVYLDLMSGAPIFEKPVELKSGDVIWLTSMTVTTSDLDFIFNCSYLPGSLCADFELDLSGCGDSIEFPEEFLTNFQSKIDENYGNWLGVVYVSSAVKANYADYDFIQVKE